MARSGKGDKMKIGDLVQWHNKPSLLGIIVHKVTQKSLTGKTCVAFTVQWANGVSANHSANVAVPIKTSETL